MVCDNDCFNCKYPDCILKENRKTYIKQNLDVPAFTKEYYKAYREKNKEQISARYKKWYREHRGEILERRRGKKHELQSQ